MKDGRSFQVWKVETNAKQLKSVFFSTRVDHSGVLEICRKIGISPDLYEHFFEFMVWVSHSEWYWIKCHVHFVILVILSVERQDYQSHPFLITSGLKIPKRQWQKQSGAHVTVATSIFHSLWSCWQTLVCGISKSRAWYTLLSSSSGQIHELNSVWLQIIILWTFCSQADVNCPKSSIKITF